MGEPPILGLGIPTQTGSLVMTGIQPGVLTDLPGGGANAKQIWITNPRLATLPTSGAAWDNVLAKSALSITANMSSRNRHNVRALAKGLVFARQGGSALRDDVVTAINTLPGTEGSDALAGLRNLSGYTIAADLVGLDAGDDVTFSQYLQAFWDGTKVPGSPMSPRPFRVTMEGKPNNFGTAAGASCAAIGVYLGDTSILDQCSIVLQAYLGDFAQFALSGFGELSWQCDQSNPVYVNAQGCTISGENADGICPDDQRRAGSFTWPPPKSNYVWTGLQGLVPWVIIMHEAGYGSLTWSNEAFKRAFDWLNTAHFLPSGSEKYIAGDTGVDDEWLPHVHNFYYSGGSTVTIPAGTGKVGGFTDWTHPG